MGEQNISNTTTASLDQELKIWTTPAEEVDRVSAGDGPTLWNSTEWAKYNGYYQNHSSVRAVMNKLGMWSVGRGYETDETTQKILEKIRGWGKDTFNSIIRNQVIVKHINGDSYAEIVRDSSGNLINLKPLNPGRIQHVVAANGILMGYNELDKEGDPVGEMFMPEDIFHLCLNRNADEIHGTGDIKSIMTYLDKIKQLDEDMTVMFHRFVVPLIIWKLNTDNATKMTAFKTQSKNARNKGEDMIIPDLAVDWSLLEAGKNGVDPLNWRVTWTEEVIKGGGVPALIMAIEAGTSEASSKMVYLAWQQVIEDEQFDLEAQIKNQLGIEIEYEFPASIEKNLVGDDKKDGEREQVTEQEVGKDQK